MQNSPWQLCKKLNARNTFRRIQLSISSPALMSWNRIKCDLTKKMRKANVMEDSLNKLLFKGYSFYPGSHVFITYRVVMIQRVFRERGANQNPG